MVPRPGLLEDRHMALRTAPQNDTKLALLSGLPLFSALRRRDITELGRHLELADVPAGAVLQRQGEPVGQWLLVVAGTLLRLRNGRPAALLPAGSSWGEALLAFGPASGRPGAPEQLVALEPTTVVLTDARRWRSLVAAYPVLGNDWTVDSYEDMEDVLGAMQWAFVGPR